MYNVSATFGSSMLEDFLKLFQNLSFGDKMVQFFGRINPIWSKNWRSEFMREVVVDEEKAYFIVIPLLLFRIYLA